MQKRQAKTQLKMTSSKDIASETMNMSKNNDKADASKGTILPDTHVPCSSIYNVYKENNQYFSVYMNNTKLATNNNKFYVMQIV